MGDMGDDIAKSLIKGCLVGVIVLFAIIALIVFIIKNYTLWHSVT